MPYTDPGAIVSGTTILSTWGNAVRNAEQYLANPPSCHAYHNATQSIPNNAVTAVALNTERYDTDAMHDTVTNNSRITIKTAGLYVIYANVVFAASTAGQRTLQLTLNGNNSQVLVGIDQGANPTVGNGTSMAVSTIWKFAVNDYFTAVAYQTSGGALNLTASTATLSQTEAGATWVGLG